MRFRLRTLIIAMMLGGPICAWVWKEWQRYHQAVEPVLIRQVELSFAKSLHTGSNRTAAGVRHAELRLKREQKRARQRSQVYWLLTPPVSY